MERYSNGKEPHWKCGVPQGIVRSSRILSAKKTLNSLNSAFFHRFLLPGPSPWGMIGTSW